MQLILLILLGTLVSFAYAAPFDVPSPSGHRVPLSLLRRHLPHHPARALRHALYEHDGARNVLRSSLHSISLDAVAPRHGLIRERAGFTLRRAGELASPAVARQDAAFVRRGESHVFAFSQNDDGSDVLVAGFAPGLALRPLDLNKFPGIYVNYERTTLNDAPAVSLPSASVSTTSLEDTAMRQATASCQPGSPTIWYEIAMSFDKTFCAQYNNVERFAVAAIQAAVLAASVPFERQSCIRLALVHLDAFCADSATDPFARPANPTAGNIQTNYKDIYQNAPFNSVRRDVAMLVSGYENIPEGNVDPAGIAGEGTLCNPDFNFAWVEVLSPSLIAHEFGHTLSAVHDDSVRNIMSTDAQIDDPFEFSPGSLRRMTTAVTGPDGACTSTDAPVCDNSCPNGSSCSNGLCVTPPPTPPTGGGVLCSRVAAFKCVTTIAESRGNFARDCDAQFNFVQRAAVDASDYEIVCCTAPSASQENTQVIDAGFPLPRLDTGSSLIPAFVPDDAPTQSVTLITATLDLTCGGLATAPPPTTQAPTTSTTTTTSTTAAPETTTTTTSTTSTTLMTTTTTMMSTLSAIVLPPVGVPVPAPGPSVVTLPPELPAPDSASDIPALPGFPDEEFPTQLSQLDNGGAGLIELPAADSLEELPDSFDDLPELPAARR